MVVVGYIWNIYDLMHAIMQVPLYHIIVEALLVLLIFRLLFGKQYSIKRTDLTEQEKDDLIAEWNPEPLVPEHSIDEPNLANVLNNVVSSKLGKYIVINEFKCLNAGTLNFLGMIGNKSVEEEAITSLHKYGVGSCGPRGFYGTIDVHLELEDILAKFMKTEEAIIYSYSFATVASAIPAYAKRGDVIFCDEGVHYAIQKGLLASRSRIQFFKHNDCKDLERLLIEQEKEDKLNPKKAKITRRFIIVEGLYMNYADICPLPELVELKWKYKVRIFVDETVSFGVLGEHGRGVTEHFNISVDQIDLISASLENSIGSIGGFCCGKSYVVDHQRLSGLGYCFSASLPPMLASGAICALKILQDSSSEMLPKLAENSRYLHKLLTDLLKDSNLSLFGLPSVPIKHLQLKSSTICDQGFLEEVVELARTKGVAFTVARYLPDEMFPPTPSIRVAVTCEMDKTELKLIAETIAACEKEYLEKSSGE